MGELESTNACKTLFLKMDSFAVGSGEEPAGTELRDSETHMPSTSPFLPLPD